MTDMARDLANLDQMILRDKYEPDVPPPPSTGDLPP
jgi:hypothetical protein